MEQVTEVKRKREKRSDEDDRRKEKRSRRDRSPCKTPKRYWDDLHKRRRSRSGSREKRLKQDKENGPVEKSADAPKAPERKAKEADMINTRTGGAYIPPARLRMMQAQITDKSTVAYQRLAWEALKKSIHGHINKINIGNCGIIIKQLLKENIVRGRGLLCRSIIQAQAASLTFTNVYAALVAAINSRFPNIGDLLLKRLVIQFKRGFKRNDKAMCISSASFIAHLVNQRVAHEILALELLTLLVETPTDDSVEVAIAFLKECGQKLTEVTSKGVHAIFEMLRNILHEGQLDKRCQYMIEVMFQVWKDGFKDHPALIEELELVPEEDQFTHLLTLDEATDSQDILNVFKHDEKFEENEQKYKVLCKEILGSDVDSDGDEEGSDGESGSEDSDEGGQQESEEPEKSVTIIDNTETNLVALRRTIYLTINSSLDFEECAHKLLKMELKPGQEKELCNMFLDCCAEQRTYEKFYGLLAQRFCNINKIYIQPFEDIFKDSYGTAHRLDTNRLRNVSKFFAHLLFTDAISWEVLECVKLNEEDTTSSSRIYIKILFQELAEYMGLKKLNDRLNDVTLQEAFSGLFPRNNPKNTRFSINFFTSIGLGGLTDELREHLKAMPKNVPPAITTIEADSSSSDSSSSSSSDSSSSDSSSSDSSDAESEEEKNKKKKKKSKDKNKKADKTQLDNKKSKTHEKEADPDIEKPKEKWGHDGFYDTYGQGAKRYEPDRTRNERNGNRHGRRENYIEEPDRTRNERNVDKHGRREDYIEEPDRTRNERNGDRRGRREDYINEPDRTRNERNVDKRGRREDYIEEPDRTRNERNGDRRGRREDYIDEPDRTRNERNVDKRGRREDFNDKGRKYNDRDKYNRSEPERREDRRYDRDDCSKGRSRYENDDKGNREIREEKDSSRSEKDRHDKRKDNKYEDRQYRNEMEDESDGQRSGDDRHRRREDKKSDKYDTTESVDEDRHRKKKSKEVKERKKRDKSEEDAPPKSYWDSFDL